jgi:hypothetical protein
MTWSGHVICVGGREEVYIGLWLGNLRDGDLLENTGINGRIILK